MTSKGAKTGGTLKELEQAAEIESQKVFIAELAANTERLESEYIAADLENERLNKLMNLVDELIESLIGDYYSNRTLLAISLSICVFVPFIILI